MRVETLNKLVVKKNALFVLGLFSHKYERRQFTRSSFGTFFAEIETFPQKNLFYHKPYV